MGGPTIAFPHPPPAIGGPGSFQSRLEEALQKRGWRVVYADAGVTPDVILVVAGTSKVGWLIRQKLRGVRIVHRLDGMSWRHRLPGPSRKKWFRAEATTTLMRFIRDSLADHVVYQSEFIRRWWHRAFGPARCPESLIYNGVDLKRFTPAPSAETGDTPPVLLCVEGTVESDPVTERVLATVAGRLKEEGVIRGTIVCGRVSDETRQRLARVPGLEFRGPVPREQMPSILAQPGAFLCLEINAPCPNAVVEALAAGLPVGGFDTGALRELVPPEAGILAPYRGDPFRLEEPDYELVVAAFREIFARRAELARGARAVAERCFSLDTMVEKYLVVLEAAMAR